MAINTGTRMLAGIPFRSFFFTCQWKGGMVHITTNKEKKLNTSKLPPTIEFHVSQSCIVSLLVTGNDSQQKTPPHEEEHSCAVGPPSEAFFLSRSAQQRVVRSVRTPHSCSMSVSVPGLTKNNQGYTLQQGGSHPPPPPGRTLPCVRQRTTPSGNHGGCVCVGVHAHVRTKTVWGDDVFVHRERKPGTCSGTLWRGSTIFKVGILSPCDEDGREST